MLNIYFTNRFKKDIKRIKKQKKKIQKLNLILRALLNEMPLAKAAREHKLSGIYEGCFECHIEPDWLLIYKRSETSITLIGTGSHSELFK